MKKPTPGGGTIESFRAAYKEYENTCTELSKSSGLSDAEFWIMLLVRDGIVTQKDICEQIFISKQTVNSASRQLERKGLIRLKAFDTDLRTKRIFLTEKGKDFAAAHIDSLSRAEERAWDALGEDEKRSLIQLTKKYNGLIRAELNDFKVTLQKAGEV